MKTFKLKHLHDDRGGSLVEVLVGMLILSVGLLGMAAAMGAAAQQVHMGQADMNHWAAMQAQVETLIGQGYAGVASDSGVVQGYPMRWTVSGTNPKKVTLVLQRTNLSHRVVADTLCFFLADPK